MLLLLLLLLHARTLAFRSEQTVLLIVAVGSGSPFFNVKSEQDITEEEVALPFLHLFARGAQVLNADNRFNLKADIFPKSSSWAADF